MRTHSLIEWCYVAGKAACVNVGPWQKFPSKPTNGWTRKGNAYHWAPGQYPNCEAANFWGSGSGECEYALCPAGSVQTNKTTCPEGVTCKMPGVDAPSDWPSACPCIRSDEANEPSNTQDLPGVTLNASCDAPARVCVRVLHNMYVFTTELPAKIAIPLSFTHFSHAHSLLVASMLVVTMLI